jgi:hypothetical protein
VITFRIYLISLAFLGSSATVQQCSSILLSTIGLLMQIVKKYLYSLTKRQVLSSVLFIRRVENQKVPGLILAREVRSDVQSGTLEALQPSFLC